MSTQTLDGAKVTNIEQEGFSTGLQGRRVWITKPNGWDWWACASIWEARQFVEKASQMTRAELVSALEA